MKKSILTIPSTSLWALALGLMLLSSCRENLEKRAAREAKEYTERCCPTPVLNNTRTDSVGFNESRKEFIYYYTFLNELDNEALVNESKQMFHDTLKELVSSDTNLKQYSDAGFRFTYIYRSASNPDKILFQDSFRN